MIFIPLVVAVTGSDIKKHTSFLAPDAETLKEGMFECFPSCFAPASTEKEDMDSSKPLATEGGSERKCRGSCPGINEEKIKNLKWIECVRCSTWCEYNIDKNTCVDKNPFEASRLKKIIDSRLQNLPDLAEA